MRQHVLGEQPFQVLAANFSISPSTEGYTLQISADGENFSDLFAVGAGITRMVTGVANGSYYRLSGNNSDVIVNWVTQCSDGGGSGSGSTYILPPATANVLGGVKIGDGINVQPDGTISVSGGTGGDVNILKSNPEIPSGVSLGDVFSVAEVVTSGGAGGWNVITDPNDFPPTDKVRATRFGVDDYFNFYWDMGNYVGIQTGPGEEGISIFVENADPDPDIPNRWIISDPDGQLGYVDFSDEDGFIATITRDGFVWEKVEDVYETGVQFEYYGSGEPTSSVTTTLYMQTEDGPQEIGGAPDMSAYWTSAETKTYVDAATSGTPDVNILKSNSGTPLGATIGDVYSVVRKIEQSGGTEWVVAGGSYDFFPEGTKMCRTYVGEHATDNYTLGFYYPNADGEYSYQITHQMFEMEPGEYDEGWQCAGDLMDSDPQEGEYMRWDFMDNSGHIALTTDGYLVGVFEDSTDWRNIYDFNELSFVMEYGQSTEPFSAITSNLYIQRENGPVEVETGYKWVDGAGRWGKWIYTDNAQGNGQYDNIEEYLVYTYLPGGSEYKLADAYLLGNYAISYDPSDGYIYVYDGDDISYNTRTYSVSIGNDVECEFSGRRFRITWEEGLITFTTLNGFFKIMNMCSTEVSKPHWERDFVNTFKGRNLNGPSPDDFGTPRWNSEGLVVGRANDWQRNARRINTTGYSNIVYFIATDANGSFSSWFIPTQPGTAGQVLTSAGDAEPVWETRIKAVKITSDAYEALAVKDPNTLYLIDDNV